MSMREKIFKIHLIRIVERVENRKKQRKKDRKRKTKEREKNIVRMKEI